MKKGKYEREKVKIVDRYLVWVILAILALGIAYAQIADQELTVSGNVESEVQEGVFISQVAYKANNGADTTNSVINYYLGTMMDSKIVLGSSSTSTISYDVTVYNNTDKEQLFIKTLTDDTDEILYSNTNIKYSVNIQDYVTTIAPRKSLTFTITFAYNGTDVSNPILNSKLNFRFKEKPVIELSNVGQTYTLENIGAGHVEEYEFTVKNNNATYTNGVPMKYEFVTTLTEGSPLTAEIYDASGNLMSGEINLKGDGTTETHTYKLKLTWDSSLDSIEYEGQEYACNVTLKATPSEEKYLDYKITKNFNVNITTCSHTWSSGTCTLCGKVCSHNYGDWETITEATCVVAGIKRRTCSICKNVETETIPATGEHNYENGVCTICGQECEHNYENGTCTICGKIECTHTYEGLEYIQSTGTQYINTGITPDSNTGFELGIAVSSFSSTQAVMGSRVAAKDSAYNIYVYKSSLRWDYYTTQTFASLDYSTDSIIKISKSGSETVFETNGDSQTVTDSTTSFSTSSDMYIFTVNTNGNLDTRLVSMKLYYFRIYKNGTLVRDFVPALDENNVACLYDSVTKQYFYNSGTGTFLYETTTFSGYGPWVTTTAGTCTTPGIQTRTCSLCGNEETQTIIGDHTYTSHSTTLCTINQTYCPTCGGVRYSICGGANSGAYTTIATNAWVQRYLDL